MEDLQHKQKYSRRDFISYLVSLLAIPVILWWLITGRRERTLSSGAKSISLGGDLPMGVSFHEGFVLIRDRDSIRAYESKCTHLGCAIRKVEGNELVCQCHGSRFDLMGNAVKGPAINPLKEFLVYQDAASGEITIQIK
ncbi:MAG: Rieske (2Fe-2S) protein [Bacteroidales bacterium]|nr:Rieske (2Fe-2S) protein [Bacteroidales bacterium]